MDWDPLVAPPPGPDVGLGKDLLSVLRDPKYTEYKDFTIIVGEEEIKVHKLLLIAVSHYFKALLEADMLEKISSTVELKGVSAQVVHNMIEYVYTSNISGPRAGHRELLATADYLQMPTITNMVAQDLMEVNVNNCFDNLGLLEEYSCVSAAKKVKEYMRSNLDDILKAHDVDQLSYENFTQIVQMWSGSEWNLFLSIKKWVDENRKQHLSDLMIQVRFRLMSPDELQTLIAMDIYSAPGGPWTSLVDSAVVYQNLPMHRRVLHESVQSAVRAEATPVGFSTHRSHALEKDGKWRLLPTHSNPNLTQGVAANVVMNNYLIVCSAFDNQQIHIFDPRTLKWAPVAMMTVPRMDFALAHDGHYLYALGGNTEQMEDSITDSMERYDFETDTWSVMNTKLPIPWCELFACQLSGVIYATSGFSTSSSQVLDRLDCYDPVADRWESKAPMMEKRPVYAMNKIKLAEEEFIVIMCDQFIMEFYNPRCNAWSLWTSFSTLHSELRTSPAEPEQELTIGLVLARDDTLFLLDFPCEVEWRDWDGHVIVMDLHHCCKEWKLSPRSRYVTERGLYKSPHSFGYDRHQHCYRNAFGVLSLYPKAADDEAEGQADY